MSGTYAGNASNWPASVTIPSDGDDKPAASVNAGLEGLADRTKWLEAREAIFEYHDNALSFTTSSVSAVLITGYTLDVPNCLVGDKLIITWNLSVRVDAGYADFSPSVLDGATDTSPIGGCRTTETTFNNRTLMSFTTVWTVATNGTFKARGKLSVDNGANTAVIAPPASIVVQRYRPTP